MPTNGEGAGAAVTQHGSVRGESSEGTAKQVGNRRRTSREGRRRRNPATPGLAAGRNKPAGSSRRKPLRWCKTTRAEHGLGRHAGPRCGIDGSQSVWTRWKRRWRGEATRTEGSLGERGKTQERRSVGGPGRRGGSGAARKAMEGAHRKVTTRDVRPRGSARRRVRSRRERGRPTTRSITVRDVRASDVETLEGRANGESRTAATQNTL